MVAEGIRAEDIRAAALEPLSPVAVKAVANLAAQALANLDAISAILAGLCPEDMAAFLGTVPGWSIESTSRRPAPRPQARRRPRPVAGSAMVAPLTADMGPQANPLLALEPPAPAPEDAP